MNKPHILLAHAYWKTHLKPGDLALDLTCGNGYDTAYLSGLGVQVFAFDIQEAAIENTKTLVPNATLFLRSHAQLAETPLPRKPQLIVYNLGYLPGSDKCIVTKPNTTIESLKQAVDLIDLGGAISITCYPGHDEGLLEEKEVITFVKQLPSKEWTICFHQWINRPRAPSLFWIYRLSAERPK